MKGLISHRNALTTFSFFAFFLILVFTSTEPAAQSFDTSRNYKIAEVLKQSEVSGRIRYFFMLTENEKDLTDYHAHAAGINLEYETGNYYGFRFNIAGSYVVNIEASDLSKPDSLTRTYNRYEAGLFNQADLRQRQNFGRVEKLNLSWSSRHWLVIAGLQPFQTAFINPQDGRMEPTVVGGLTAKGRCSKRNLDWQLSWLGWISPRGTQHWFRAENSIGIYGQGKNPGGGPADHLNHLSSSGIIYGSFSKQTKHVKFQITEQLVTNIFNTALLQLDYNFKAGLLKWMAGVQGLQQFSVNHGGNIDPEKAYFSAGQQSWAYSARLGISIKNTELFFNYTRITKNGCYLMPREWGRDPFYTFIQRERTEGIANMDAVSINFRQELLKSQLSLELAYGRYYLPAASDSRKNKYGMPSYDHSKLQVNYGFRKTLSGLQISTLLIYKKAIPEKPSDPKYSINKVDMANVNFVLNYQFAHAFK